MTISINSPAQTILIDSTFDADGEIFPFGQNDTIYGLSVSGSVDLYSDTSLVRVILSDTSGNEWMVYEAYPMIVSDTSFTINEVCDETCFLDETIPFSVKVLLFNASIYLASCNISLNGINDPVLLQYQYKIEREIFKVAMINNYISNHNWSWEADTNFLSNIYYHQKSSFFSYKYNLLGYDYYSDGIYKNIRATEIYTDNSSYIKSFDWRNKHDANVSGTYYFDDNPDYPQVYNGWMTKVNNQDPCGACTAFGSISALEALVNLYYNYHVDKEEILHLSERDAFNCSQFGEGTTDVGCLCDPYWGKPLIYVLNHIVNNGIVDEECFPWISPWCVGKIPDCSHDYSGKCEESERRVTIQPNGKNVYYKNPHSTLVARLKTYLITDGPVICVLNLSPTVSHVVALVGFGEAPETYELLWYFKDSFGATGGSQNSGYRILSHAALLEQLDEVMFSFSKSLITDPENYLSRKKFDHDKDGYWNWGIGNKPEGWNPPCSQGQEPDWNDNRNRIGPRDDNYYGQPIQPEMKVCWYREMQPKEYIENNSFFAFDDSDLNSLDQNTFVFRIENPGNAQLNLEILNTITSNNPDFYEVDIIDLDYEICMFDGYTEFTVKYYPDPQEANPIGAISIDVAEDDEDVIPGFTFYMVYYDCSPAMYEQTISKDETWSGYKLKTMDYRIQSGVTLTVDGTIGMAEESDIFLEPGAQILIDGGCLTGLCGKFWNGIDLWGDARELQLEEYQGYARLINGGSIEYAKKGIETGRFDGIRYVPSGGIVYCDSAFFKDNQIAIKFYPYHYVQPGGVQVPNMSRIKNTCFETTDSFYDLDYNPLIDPLHGIYINDIWGLNILGCDFINSSDYSNNVRGNGIFSSDAGYYVEKRCINPIPPFGCEDYEICTFKDLDYGIEAYGSGSEWLIKIDTACFIGNYRGIFMSAINDPVVTQCSFDCKDDSDRFNDLDAIYGLYLDHCNRFQVEENIFMSGFNESGQEAVGIHILNSSYYGNYNEIYNNSFNDFHTGITAAGDNRDTEGIGLCIICNDFNYCETDVYVTKDGGVNPNFHGIATEQGVINKIPPFEPDSAAGNTFSDFDYIDFNYKNDGNLSTIHYVHHDILSTESKVAPSPYVNISPEEDYLASYDKDLSCPSNLAGGGINPSAEKSVILSEELAIQSLEDTINLLVDGGDTPGMDFDIQTSFPDDALQLRQNLLSESPYLSDTVLKSAIAKEDVLLNAMIRDVLVSNPQVAKTPSILDKLDDREDPMPEYMMAEIMQGSEYYGAKEILLQKLAKYKSKHGISLGKLMRYYKNDTTNQYINDSLVNILEMAGILETEYEIAFLSLEENDTNTIEAILDSIPMVFTLSTEEEEIHDFYVELFDILTDIHVDTCTIDSAMQQRITDLYNETETLPGIYARNLLIVNKLMSLTEPVYLAENQLKNSPVYNSGNKKLNDYNSNLKVFPNPSNTFFIVEYNITEFDPPGIILMLDQLGHIVKKYPLRGKQNQIVISNDTFFSGVYLIQLFVGNRLLSVEKVVIQ